MFLYAFDLLTRNDVLDKDMMIACLKLLGTACLSLTEGQELDIEFEQRNITSREKYIHVVEGKTAALIAFGMKGWGCGEIQR